MIVKALPNERLVLYGGALAASILAGAFVAKMDFVWVVAAIGVMTGTAMLVSREATLWFVLISGFVVVGVSQMYLPQGKYIKYLPVLAAAGLLLHVTADWLSSPRRAVPITVPLFLAFLALSVISIGANWTDFGMATIGLKSYYPMWALFLGLALIRWKSPIVDSLPKAALVLAFLQLPFVAHQALVLAPRREGVPGLVSVDIIAGTFGGDVWGGGANAVLSVFLITVVACLLGMWRQGALKGWKAIAGSLLFILPVALNNSRVALVYVPLVFGVVFFSDIVRHPLRVLTGMFLTVLLVLGMLTSFTDSRDTRSWTDFVRSTYESQLDSERSRAQLYVGFTRLTVLKFWVDEQRLDAPAEILIGHGPGATRVHIGNLAETMAERRYGGRMIGYTAVAALLWEVGVLGLALVLAMFWAAFRQASGLVKYYSTRDPTKAGIARGLRAGVLILAISLAHSDFFAFHVPYQALMTCVFGYLAAQTHLVRSMRSAARSAAGDASRSRRRQ